MILRHKKTGIPAKYLFNAGGAAFLVLTAVLTVRATFYKEEAPVCEARYSSGVLFSYARRSGEPLTATDLQSRVGGSDWGLVDNVHIVEAKGAPSGFALEVALRSGTANVRMPSERKSGTGFTWSPSALGQAQSACLTYNVMVPPDFSPGGGGRLPGLVGGDDDRIAAAGTMDPGRGFLSFINWRPDNGLDVMYQQANEGERKRVQRLDDGKVRLPRGKWMRIDQEIVLNKAKTANGILRIWIDGKLTLERKGLMFRTAPEQGFLAVVGDVHNTRSGLQWEPALKNTWLRISPLEVRLQ